MQKSKQEELEPQQELKARVTESLKNQGFKVTEDAQLRGKSGVNHSFDILAQRDDGFVNHIIAIGVTNGSGNETELNNVFNLANKAYDTGILDRIIISTSTLNSEARQLAQKQRIKVFDGERVEVFLPAKPTRPAKSTKPFSYETKSKLLESLRNLGYRVEEQAKVQGRSGVEYTFDILAYSNDEHIGHSVGIDFMLAEKQAGLAQITLFDTKAYDVGIDYKTIVVPPELDSEAKQFAQHQRIKVLELTQEQVPQFLVTPATPTQPKTKPAKPKVSELSATEAETKSLISLPQPEALQLIPEVMARRYNAIPISVSGNTLRVAMADPTDIFALEAFSAQSRKRLQTVASNAKAVRAAIDAHYKGYGEIERQLSHIALPGRATDERLAVDAAIDAPLAQALNLIVDEAAKARSSDIHVEPEEDRLRIRYRIDGTLQDMMSLSLNIHPALISRIKILADMNIADHHHPQDGQFSHEARGREIDIRVATAPTVNGEMAVLRLLDKSLATLELSELGLLPDSQAKFEVMLKVPYGMILVSGPTGAGKTTTLYAAVNTLDKLGRNIVTIEDPVEYRFEDINQIQVNLQAGITFASGLRSILRLDPDVILVGEVRDVETANIAVQAALTGHLMLSSIHANDATGVFFRLIDLGVEPFLISSSVIGIVAQRMVRRICPDCRHLIEAPMVERMAYEKEMREVKTEFLYGTGCKTCTYTGYLGRTGIFEILSISDSIRTMLASGANASEIRGQAVKEGMLTMLNDGMRKVEAGVTTPAEVLRSAFSPD